MTIAPPTSTAPGSDPEALLDQLRRERAEYEARDRARSTWMVVSVVIAGLALVASAVAWGFASTKKASTAGTGALTTVSVSLTEFKISPAAIEARVGDSLQIKNAGSIQHNFTVQDTSLATAMLNPGGSATLDTSGLSPGTYTVFCAVPGHEAAGMKATLHLAAGAGAGGATATTMNMGSSAGLTPAERAAGMTMSAAAMEQAMKSSTTAFPAKTQGPGFPAALSPTVLADGTKQFELTAQVVRWQVAPDKWVNAWTYNGTVPGPTIRVNPGDKVKVILHNHLPEATTIHFHGITGPESIDGVPYLSQPPVEPGQDWTYSWTVAKTPQIGMYHSHFDAVNQVEDGMAGAFYVGNPALPASVTAQGVAQANLAQYEMFLNDSGTLGMTINGKSFPATAPIVATQGQWIEVTYFNEGQMIHPMHLHELPQMLIAQDGFPLPAETIDDTINVAPGQRMTILVHATDVGTWVWHCHILQHAEGPQGMFGLVTAVVVKPAA